MSDTFEKNMFMYTEMWEYYENVVVHFDAGAKIR